MRVTLLVSTFNSLTQAVYTALRDRREHVDVVYAIHEAQMLQEIKAFEPELILSPFLKQYIPPSIYENYPTFIFHPGPRGDRGPHALEHALQSQSQTWGVTILRANEHYDGGDIYAEVPFALRETYKASLYRQEVVQASLKALDLFYLHYMKNDHDDSCVVPQKMNPLHHRFTEEMRRIDWENDDTLGILKKIYLSDSLPGVYDVILGVPCYLFGGWREEKLCGKPKEILAKRDGAICLGTIDGAVWITHLKAVGGFKLPATYVLKERLEGVKEHRLPLIFDKSYETFYEVSMEKRDNVAYLCFNFHNGAMSAEQCIRLKYAVEHLKEQCDVLVLIGGMDYFSNGIHLNILEDSAKQGEDGWSNINAMNDLVQSILFAEEVVTIASFGRNAGAGGLFMGLACDHVVAKEGIVLNPHYKTLGLSGSEYHTYTLPKRVGEKKAAELLDACLPISVNEAKSIGMIDEVFSHEEYYEALHQFAKASYDDDFLWEKAERLWEEKDLIEAYKEKELAVMYPEFWDEKSEFHHLRQEFVYKCCPRETPERLKGKKDA